MHELSVATAIVEQVHEAAIAHGATRVGEVTVAVGRLCGVVPDALAFNFDLAAATTLLEGARLQIEARPVVVHCDVGDHLLTLDGVDLWCDTHCCTTPDVRSGRELQVVSFEIADDDHATERGTGAAANH